LRWLLDNWSVSGISNFATGGYTGVTFTTTDNFDFTGGGERCGNNTGPFPNVTGDVNLPRGERTIDRWFNTGAFTAAEPFTIGTSSRNPVRGPSYRNLDLAMMRRVPLQGSTALEVRVEVFNVTNTPPFGAPNTTVGSAAFGTITTAADPRVIQLAAKFTF
jgi:hypothetical protein